MGEYRITGGRRLSGEVAIGGAKNAALPILAAAVLGGRSIIHNCPRISDIFCTLEILTALGCAVSFIGNTVVVDTRGIEPRALPQELATKMRSSIIFAGGLLGRFGYAEMAQPGGCKLGKRQIDLHLSALRSLGAVVDVEEGIVHAKADRLVGADIMLAIPSVGATQNAMLAAVMATGTSVIHNAAREPEIVDLQNYLVKMGAKVAGAGGGKIVVDGLGISFGTKHLRDAEHSVMPDRIVAGTYMAAAAITGGNIRLNRIVYDDIRPTADVLAAGGVEVTVQGDSVEVCAAQRFTAVKRVTTAPHPGFPTDMQPQISALLATAAGRSNVVENIFDSRDRHVAELAKMGANILNIGGRHFDILGVERLHGATVTAHDLRCGAALILAGLGADGKTIVTDSVHVERGYEGIDADLRALGADVNLIPDAIPNLIPNSARSSALSQIQTAVLSP